MPIIKREINTDSKTRDFSLEEYKIFTGLILESDPLGFLEADTEGLMHAIDYKRIIKNPLPALQLFMKRGLMFLYYYKNKVYFYIPNKKNYTPIKYWTEDLKDKKENAKLMTENDLEFIEKNLPQFFLISSNLLQFSLYNKDIYKDKDKDKTRSPLPPIVSNNINKENVDNFVNCWNSFKQLVKISVMPEERIKSISKLLKQEPWDTKYKEILTAFIKYRWWLKPNQTEHLNWKPDIEWFLKNGNQQKAITAYEKDISDTIDKKHSFIKEFSKHINKPIPDNIKNLFLDNKITADELKKQTKEYYNNDNQNPQFNMEESINKIQKKG